MLTFVNVRLVVRMKGDGDGGIFRPDRGSFGMIFLPALWCILDPQGPYAL